jgi:DNA-binding beta-propeller fold protein YncE
MKKYFLPLLTLITGVIAIAPNAQALNITRLSNTTSFGAEIPAYDPLSRRLFVTTPNNTLDVLDISNPANPTRLNSIPLAAYGAGVNSVAVKNGRVAVALEANSVTDNGSVAFFDSDGNFQAQVGVGALPDMLTFTPDGSKVLVANEGEPRAPIDPVGSVSIIDVSNFSVATAGFESFDAATLRAAGVRIFPGKTVAEDVEPEYITVSEDGTKAWVALQENNALAVLDILNTEITAVLPLGTKDHSLADNALDPSDRDGGININPWPVRGLYMPDTIASFSVGGQTYVVSANEGDARNEVRRVSTLSLDPTAFPNAATLQQPANLGRLEVSSIDGFNPLTNQYEALYSYGARSFSVWNVTTGIQQVFDSGSDFEDIVAALTPSVFNSNGEPSSFDDRSDSKGPEPEGIALGKIGNRLYSFTGLERSGGFMAYDITNPLAPQFTNYVNDWQEGDRAPEGLLFIPASDSPNGLPLLVVANEASQNVAIYSLTVPEPSAIMGFVLLGFFGWRKQKSRA